MTNRLFKCLITNSSLVVDFKLLLLFLLLSYCVNNTRAQMQTSNEDNSKKTSGSSNSGGGGGGAPPIVPAPSPNSNFYNYLRCWRCDYDDKDQCVKNFDFTKHKHEACDGKCLKAFEKVEARTKTEIDKAQMTPTIRKCVSQREINSLQALGINTKNGCHDIRTTKRKHKLYCFCENDLCNEASRRRRIDNFVFLVFNLILSSCCLFLFF